MVGKNLEQILKEKWLRLGLSTLDEKGYEYIKIADLCKQLNVTKGAFYYWFKSKQEFDSCLLEAWRSSFTQQFIAFSSSGQSSQEKLSLLVTRCIEGLEKSSRLEIEINMWAQKDQKVNQFVQQVYQQRLSYLMDLLSDIYSPVEAKRHSLMLYCLLIGCDLFFRQLTRQEAELIFRDYLLKVEQ
ncbi:TetR/AcrR family transcriptional regulator [Paraglaciecola aquimarina]|uniref:TetR/AcrR family transcriptional regulator n=1 Tax=Paraglaciecola aquimarina TaxID=1235557 RepID=A0ABU3STG9_9ALTE|nr:TetR/AcrR family transcriptional regulator [Paraglaciecola aquimarina]MDU0353262.1 TetR/AcrR family transcriptional regulator [Paraglaciecola aquimarina]